MFNDKEYIDMFEVFIVMFCFVYMMGLDININLWLVS